MATIREHEPAEGLRKENREISAKMKEDEQMQKDTDAEKRTEATEAGAQPPKKKNIIQAVSYTHLKAPQHLKENAVLILYVTEPQFVAEAVRRHPEYWVEEMFLLNEKNRTTVYVLRYLKK